MSFKDLDKAERGILRGLITGEGSTSEGLATGFISGDLSFFTGHHKKFSYAWDRLDGGQKAAVIELRELCHVDKFSESPSTIQSFVSDYIEWQKKKFVLEAEIKYLDSLKGDFDYEKAELHFKENLAPGFLDQAKECLSAHL